MTAYTGFVDNSTMLAHYKMLETIRDVCLAEGWTILRYDTAITNRELLMMGRYKRGDLVVIVAGAPPGTVGSTNLIHVHRIGEDDH